MLKSNVLRRVKKIQEDRKAKTKEMIETAERISAEKIHEMYNYHQQKIKEKEEEIPIIIKGIQAELEIMENSEPQRLREIFIHVKGGMDLIERRLNESSEQFELFQRKKEEELRHLEEQKQMLQEQGPSRRQQVTEL